VLSDAERWAIAETIWAKGLGTRSPLLQHLLEVVEETVARHVTAALNDAADAIEADFRSRRFAKDTWTQAAAAGIASGVDRAADLIRSRART
jgi:hypothetical protein